jgi:predicted nucleic acid-binding protein
MVDQNPVHAEKEKRSRHLLFDLEEAKAKIVIPSLVLTELLLPIDSQHHGTFLAVMSQRFYCPPYDLPSTSLAARLWQRGRTLPPEERGKRAVLKADAMIVATAKQHGARFFYTDDGNCRKLAEWAGLVARPLPTHSLNLFAGTDATQPAAPSPPTTARRLGRGMD